MRAARQVPTALNAAPGQRGRRPDQGAMTPRVDKAIIDALSEWRPSGRDEAWYIAL